MKVDVVAPKTSLTAQEITVLEWKKKVGDPVQKDEVLAIVETEKSETEVVASVSGTVALVNVSEGATIPVGSVMCVLESRTEFP